MLKIVQAYPPNYEEICAAFPIVRDRSSVVFTYGETLYAPGNKTGSIPHDLRVHEETHVRQQAEIGVEEWWKRYMADPQFRLDQEVDAYHNQYMAMSKPDRDKHIRRIAGDLCGPMYGNLVSLEEAKRLIRNGLFNA